MEAKILIVGGGPVGLTLACEFARYGVPFRIVDKAAERTDKSKALVLWSRTLELMERGLGTAPFLDVGFKVEAVSFLSGDKQIGHVSMASVDTPYPYALMIPQSETERLLGERLTALGVTVERSVEVTDIENGATGVRATLRHANGTTEQIETDWLVGCDGAHSVVRHSLKAPFEGETNDSDWMLADVHMTGYPVPDNEAAIYWHKDGAFVIFPITPGRYRLLADLPASGAVQTPTPTLEQVQAIIDRRGPPGMKAFDPIWLAGFRINGRKVAHYRWGRTFLAGDAAHVHSPAGGQGMNTGMQDAFNLAWKLSLVIAGTCQETLLDSYDAERSYVGDQVLKSASRLTTVGTLRNPLAQGLRNIVGHAILGLAPVRQSFADTMTEITIGYPQSPLNGSAPRGNGPKPGGRIAPVAGEVAFGSGGSPRFALAAEPNAELEALVARFPEMLDKRLRVPRGNYISLVRPDGYLACTSVDPSQIEDYLRERVCSTV